MQILFINTNPIVQKLIEVTAAKANVKLVTVREPSQIGDIAKYDYIIADDGCYGIDKSQYKQIIKNRRACLIYSKEMYSGFSEYIKKPFIPTHILNIIIEEIAKSKKEHSFESIEEEVMPEDMSVDSVLQATRAMRTQEDSLSNLDLLSKELNIKHPENVSQDKASTPSAPKQEENEPPAKEISTEDLLADTDLHKDDEAPETLDIDDINLDDLVNETPEESPSQETAKENPPQEPAQSKPQSTPEAQIEQAPAPAQDDSAGGEPQVLDKEQISEVSELLDAIGGDEAEAQAQESAPAQDEAVQDSALGEEALELNELDTNPAPQEVPSQEAPLEPQAQDTNQDSQNAQNDEASDLDLDALGLELAQESDKSTESTDAEKDAEELDLDSLDLGKQEEDKQPSEAQDSQVPAQENEEQISGEPDSQEAQEFFADASSAGSADDLGELASQDEQVAPQEEEQPQDLPAQSPQDSEADLALADEAQLDLQEAGDEIASAELSLDEETVAQADSVDSAQDLASEDVQLPVDEPDSTESVATEDLAGDVDVDMPQDSKDSNSAEDFATLNENEVAVALGEEPLEESLGEESQAQAPQEATPEESSSSSSSNATPADIDVVKNAIGKSLEGALQSMASSELKTLLDGMEVSINISFKDAKK